MTRTDPRGKAKKRTRTAPFSPRQLANQYNFAYNARIRVHCIDLAHICKAFNRPDLTEELLSLQRSLEVELEARVSAIRNSKGGESVSK